LLEKDISGLMLAEPQSPLTVLYASKSKEMTDLILFQKK